MEMETTRFINLTPHAITICLLDGKRVEIPASGQIARVATTREPAGCIGGVPAFVTRAGEVTGLPEPVEGTVYIVSTMVRNHPAVAYRRDVCSPGGLIRDEEGRIIGCDGLDFNIAPSVSPAECLADLIQSASLAELLAIRDLWLRRPGCGPKGWSQMLRSVGRTDRPEVDPAFLARARKIVEEATI